MIEGYRPIAYDLEVLRNFFLYLAKSQSREYSFEVSSRKNQLPELLAHLNVLMSEPTAIMVGYNNNGYDYQFIHMLIQMQMNFTYEKAYQLNQRIIQGPRESKPKPIWPKDRVIKQLDLMALHGLGSKLRGTSLKSLQVAMRSERVENIPFVDKELTSQEMDETIEYGWHDVKETFKFCEKSKDEIDFRLQLIKDKEIQGDVLNMDDVKIGANYIIQKIGRDKCYRNGQVINTQRKVVDIGKLILPNIKFEGEKYQKVLDWFKSLKVEVGDKEEKPKYNYKDDFDGLEIHFGLGGLHGAKPGIYEHNYDDAIDSFGEDQSIWDIDVAGMYPAVAIANGFYPRHLGDKFSKIYSEIPERRAKTKKGTPINMMLKLAGNSVYGNSMNPYSPIYDPALTYSVTVNGQLQMLMLSEMLRSADGYCGLIQINTDGLTMNVHNEFTFTVSDIMKEWEEITGLKLEQTVYEKMIVKNVNAYCAYDFEGKAKLKKEYYYPTSDKDYQGAWHKNYSKLVVPKAVQAVYQGGMTPEQAVKSNFDRFDFMLAVKSKGKNIISIGGEKKPGIIRYYISKTGLPMEKIDTPKDSKLGKYKRKNGIKDKLYKTVLAEIPEGTWDARIHTKNKSRYETKSSSQHKKKGGGVYLVKECNDASNFDWSDVDYDFYIEEVEKLLI